MIRHWLICKVIISNISCFGRLGFLGKALLVDLMMRVVCVG